MEQFSLRLKFHLKGKLLKTQAYRKEEQQDVLWGGEPFHSPGTFMVNSGSKQLKIASGKP